MKKVLAATLIAGSTISSAFAADLPSRHAPILAPPPPVFTWSGFYVGLNAGYTVGNRNGFQVVGAPAFTNPAIAGVAPIQNAIDAALTGIGSTGGRGGAILGGQAGYNWQFGTPFLLGIETDIQGVVSTRSTGLFGNLSPIAGVAGINVQNIGAVSKRTDYLGTVRARAGYGFTPTFMAYVTGGLAYGGVKASTTTLPSFAPDPGGVLNAALPISGANRVFSNTRVGYTIGAGVEWMFMPSWSLKAEYLYYDLGSASYNGLSNFAGPGVGLGLLSQDLVRTRVRFDGHIARLGVNYHFWAPAGGPVVARY